MWTNAIYFHLLGTVPVWELEDIHTSYQNILLIFIRNLFLSVLYIALSSKIVFLALLLCTVHHSDCFLCFLLFDVRLSHLINITYIHTYSTSSHPTNNVKELKAGITGRDINVWQVKWLKCLPCFDIRASKTFFRLHHTQSTDMACTIAAYLLHPHHVL